MIMKPLQKKLFIQFWPSKNSNMLNFSQFLPLAGNIIIAVLTGKKRR